MKKILLSSIILSCGLFVFTGCTDGHDLSMEINSVTYSFTESETSKTEEVVNSSLEETTESYNTTTAEAEPSESLSTEQVSASSDSTFDVQIQQKKEYSLLATTTDTLNFRSSPNILDDNVIYQILPNTPVIITDYDGENDFYGISFDGDNGFLAKEYISINKSCIFYEGKKIYAYPESDGSYLNPNTLEELNPDKVVPIKSLIEEVKNSKEKELLTSFSTIYSCEDYYATKGYNINLCCDEVTTILTSGETFNWFEVVGNTGEAEGYKIANTYVGNEVVPGYGGGVCQVSSTLYNCVLNLGLEVIERHAHSMPVYYVDYENQKDATVGDIGGPNFVFKNNKDYDIFIECYTTKDNTKPISEQGILTINFYKVSI